MYEKDQDEIYYRSRYGHDLENWAIFDPFLLPEKRSEATLTPEDPALLEALGILWPNADRLANPSRSAIPHRPL